MCLLGLLILLACFSGCGDQSDLDRVFADGSALASHLVSYYETLASIELDAWKNQTVHDILLKVPVNPDGAATREQTVAALKRRAAAARAMAGLYSGLAALRDPAGLKNVEQAGKDLGDALSGIKQLPGAQSISGDQFAKAADSLTNLERGRQVQQALPPLNQFLSGFSQLFGNEKDAYLSIDANRVELAQHLLAEALTRKIASPGGLLPKTLLGASLNWPADEATSKAANEVARITVARSEQAWSCATAQTALLFATLLDLQRQSAPASGAPLRAFDDQLAQAKACLADYNMITKVEP